jgi:predicted flap endonuclease-1-like 5' DNA nuclease
MKVLRVFFVGLVYGWLLRWVIDKIFLEENLRTLADENALLRERILALETPQPQASRVSQRTGPAPLPVEHVEPVPASQEGMIVSQRDDLKMIKGIGPKMEQKLNDAGVHTFAQMSRLTPTQLQNILGISKRVVQSSDNFISQAKKFAEEGPQG